MDGLEEQLRGQDFELQGQGLEKGKPRDPKTHKMKAFEANSATNSAARPTRSVTRPSRWPSQPLLQWERNSANSVRDSAESLTESASVGHVM